MEDLEELNVQQLLELEEVIYAGLESKLTQQQLKDVNQLLEVARLLNSEGE